MTVRLVGLGVCLIAGCSAGTTSSPDVSVSKPAITATVDVAAPGVVEIVSAKARRSAENIIHFEVAYKFTSGSPVKNYMLNLTFPGTSVSGQKPMDAWEVKPEGIIKTGLPVADPAAKSFEITFAEADSPDRGYTVISNMVSGEVEPVLASAAK